MVRAWAPAPPAPGRVKDERSLPRAARGSPGARGSYRRRAAPAPAPAPCEPHSGVSLSDVQPRVFASGCDPGAGGWQPNPLASLRPRRRVPGRGRGRALPAARPQLRRAMRSSVGAERGAELRGAPSSCAIKGSGERGPGRGCH